MFRRRRRDPAEPVAAATTEDDTVDDTTQNEQSEQSEPAGQGEQDQSDGAVGVPGDTGSDDAPELPLLDLGSLQVPVMPDLQIHLEVVEDEELAYAAVVMVPDGALQLQAFAAPKKNGLWEEVRTELAEGVDDTGGTSEEVDGRFGTELWARVPLDGDEEDLQPVRIIGVDGPRWLLKGSISGPAADDPELATVLEQVLAGTAVVRGEAPMPPREPLPLQIPAWMRDQMPEGDEADQEGDSSRHGPEVTEVR